MPPFFEPALQNPQVLENLWQQTLSAYVNNPLPALFKEKLFAHLSRYCTVPYCIVCHSCALRPLGMKAKEILALLEAPAPALEADIERRLEALRKEPGPLMNWTEPCSDLEESLLRCSEFTFLSPDRARQVQAQMQRLLGPDYTHWVAFLAYIKTCHLWVECHPELSYKADERVQKHLKPLVQENPELDEFFHTYNERVRAEYRRREELLIAEITKYKLTDVEVRRIREELEKQLVQQKTQKRKKR